MFSKEKLTRENILNHIRTIYAQNYRDGDISLIERVLNDMVDLFHGTRKGYQACDTQYHNLFHTFQTIPPFVEMIDGWNKSKATPNISEEYFRFGTIGVLLHDTGYIKTEGDNEGTGAKYTFTHMQRSIDFARWYLEELGFKSHIIPSLLNIIRCTGVTLDMNIEFCSEEERLIGYALGTADLLGQMSAEDYIDKIPVLYTEFAEAYHFASLDKSQGHNSTMPKSAEDLLRSTPKFYEDIALARFKMMGSMHLYVQYHYEGSRNPYMEAIEKNIKKIKESWVSR